MATIKARPEDFVVDEIPAYEPSGEGTHLFVHFRKTNLTTDEAVRNIARDLGVERRDIGVAGQKDKVAVTTQWISVPASAEPKLKALPGIEILEAKRHGHKLKTGHLKGNRFTIVVRGVSNTPEVEASMKRISEEGVPNAFGTQRFGRDNDTHLQARAWLTGATRAPGDPRLRRFHFSAWQSFVFNEVLAARVTDGSWRSPILGDLLKKEETGGLFVCTDVQIDRERADKGELCPTGPIVGDRMRQPEADAFAFEQRITAPLIEGIDLHRARSLGEGTRRALRLRVSDLSYQSVALSRDETTGIMEEDRIQVRFVLPKGAYATTVLENVFSLADSPRDEKAGAEEDE